jgi:hypothetical protein
MTGINLSPLFHSTVVMAGPGVTTNYLDDHVVRIRASVLPSGRVGAIFRGIRLLNVTAAVRLNFTVTYPGGFEYFSSLQAGDMPQPPFRRAGGGFPELPRRYNSSFDLFQFQSVGLLSPLGIGNDAIPALYRGFDEVPRLLGAGTVGGLSCGMVPAGPRRQWCQASGFTLDLGSISPGVMITSPIAVTGIASFCCVVLILSGPCCPNCNRLDVRARLS